MASAEDQALKILERQVADLTAQLQALTSERDEYRDALSEVANERDGLKTQPDAAARIAELEGKLRDRAHFDKFAEIAKGDRAKEKALKSLWREAQEAGYKVEGDEPDEAAIKGIVKKIKSEADYYFDPEEVPGSPNKPPPFQPGQPPASGRSARNDGGDGTVITREMLANPAYMLAPGRQAQLAAQIRDQQAKNGSPGGGPFLRDR